LAGIGSRGATSRTKPLVPSALKLLRTSNASQVFHVY
jgi:hypothetical protein